MVSYIRSPSKATFRIGAAAIRMRAQYVTFAPVNFTKRNVRHIMRIKTTRLMRRNKLVITVQYTAGNSLIYLGEECRPPFLKDF